MQCDLCYQPIGDGESSELGEYSLCPSCVEILVALMRAMSTT